MTTNKKIRKNFEEKTSALIMVAPAIILLTIFVLTPLGIAIYRSFFDYRVGAASSFVGFGNYIKTLRNANFTKSIWNVLWMSLVITVVQVIITFLFASLLTKSKGKFSEITRTVVYIPFLLSGIVVSVIFTLLTTYNGGFINYFLGLFDIEPIPFNNHVVWSPISIIVPTIWIGFGYYSLVMYAGIKNVPISYYEAAEMDGAGFFRKTISITLPCMKNYFVLMIITLVVANMQMFEIPLVMTNGQPANRTMVPVLYLIHARSNGNVSDGEITAAAILIMIIILVINSAVFTMFRTKKENREII